jgi:signal transduction histidine kinase/ActR/RegA family two-component response regulator
MRIDNCKSLLTAAAELRRQAEEQLYVKTAARQSPQNMEEIQRIVHELEVHQIELEMQNAELFKAREELDLSRDNYIELYDFAPIGYFTFDSRGMIRGLNLTGARLLGKDRGVLVNKPFATFIDDADGREVFAQHLETVSRREGMQRCEVKLRGKGGTLIYAQLQSVMLDNVGSKDINILCSIVDGTVGKDLESGIQSANTANAAKSRFLSNMSHEIRTPMNGIIGAIQLLEHTELTPEQRELVGIAKTSGIKLVYLLSDILDLSKIEEGKIELDISDFDLRPVISDTINLLLLQSREKGVKLTATIDTDVPTALKGDAGRLRQIIINLVGNAIKFTNKGFVTLHIQKDSEDEHNVTLRFLVHDSGIGIAANKLEQIFAPFSQVDSTTTRKYGGTGLGLTISRNLAEMMGGSVSVESVEGQGSTFWFTVVVGKQGEESLPDPHLPVAGFNSSPPSAGESGQGCFSAPVIRILLVEDDPDARKIVPKLLKYYGYQVDVAADGKKALQALEENEYALVLMDCMMPEMDGYEAIAVIRDQASVVRSHDIPVIALTGNAMKHDRDKCIAVGMDDHLTKPLLLSDMLAMLEKWLKMKV